MWPGFDARLILKSGGIFLNIEPCHKVIRYETAMDYILSIKDNCENKGLDVYKEIRKEFERCTVITLYNNKCY